MFPSCCLVIHCLIFQGHTNNFGHPAVRDLLHVFLYGRNSRIGNLRPDEFGTRIPNGTLCLAVTAVSSEQAYRDILTVLS